MSLNYSIWMEVHIHNHTFWSILQGFFGGFWFNLFFSVVSVGLACPLIDIISLGVVAFTFDDVGEEAPATDTSCCFCNAACKLRKSEDTLTRKAKNGTFTLRCILIPSEFLPHQVAPRNSIHFISFYPIYNEY